MSEADLPYQIMDADNHFNEPADCYERYIDPQQRHLAIRYVKDAHGQSMQLFAGRPSKFTGDQIVFSADTLKEMLGTDPTGEDNPVETPGIFLNRLNSLKGLTDTERTELLEQFREQRESYGNRELRLALMNEQGIQAALMFPASAHDIEYEFADNVDAIYANVRAFNRWMHEEVGFAYESRLFLPPYLPLADVDLALRELETLLAQGAPVIQIKSGHAHGGGQNPYGGRSIADPIYDPIWARINESNTRVAVHLGGTDYQKYGADWSEDPEVTFGQFDAFQWMMYWGDRPAIELTSALILHNLFGRFPNIRVCLSEQGTVWLPYTLRKMDHAFMMGRKAKWSSTGRLDRRPSEIFRSHFVVAPFPEENVRRVVDEVGITSIVFGSDFPHGEGLAWPKQYVPAQLAGFTEEEKRTIMRDNLANFLDLPV
jgi:predicted TIM-barrel fold metal-dependent hydrolase